MKKTWIAGTRGSKLALRQTELVLDRLRPAHPDMDFSVRVIRTTGDTVWDRPLHLIGGKGLFVKEIEDALLNGQIDFAVHSVKDLPTELDAGLVLGAVMEREDPRDAFLSRHFAGLALVPRGARIGTSSLRRKAQILSFRPDIEIVPIRGNVDTRLRKLTTEALDGIVLALAGVKRMGHLEEVTERLSLETIVPPSGQGAIGVETRGDSEALALLAILDDTKTRAEISIERGLQALIGGGCQVPLGINAQLMDDGIALHVVLGREDGTILFKEHGLFDKAELQGRIPEIAGAVRRAAEA